MEGNTDEVKEWKTDAKECYVAFIDIIGFSQIISKEDERIKAFLSVLNEANRNLNKEGAHNYRFKSISDSVIIYIEKTDGNLRGLIHQVAFIQAKFLSKNILTRGGISFGEVYENKELNILLGKGIVNAYKLEKLASNPRVIIDPKIVYESLGNNGTFPTGFGMIISAHTNNTYEYTAINPSHKLSNDEYLHINYSINFLIDCLEFNFSLPNLYTFLRDAIYKNQVDVQKYYWVAKEFESSFEYIINKFDRSEITKPFIEKKEIVHFRGEFKGL